MLFIFIIAALVLLEQYFIKNKDKAKIILPVAVMILSLIFSSIQFAHVDFGTPTSYMTKIDYISRSGVKSHLTILHTETDRILAIGQLITDEEANSKFIDLTVKNNKIISTSEPVDLTERIESNLSQFKEDFSGESIPYGKLLALETQYKKQQPYRIDFAIFLYRFFCSLIPAAILFIMLGIDGRKGGVNKG